MRLTFFSLLFLFLFFENQLKVSFTATYYGKAYGKTHVAVLVKAHRDTVKTDRPKIVVDIKTQYQALSDALIQELKQVFPSV